MFKYILLELGVVIHSCNTSKVDYKFEFRLKYIGDLVPKERKK